MCALKSDQVIATVVRWSKNDSIAGATQGVHCLTEHGGRQSRAIGVDEAQGLISGRKKIFRSVQEALPKIPPTLG
jgi:hypothetical protein